MPKPLIGRWAALGLLCFLLLSPAVTAHAGPVIPDPQKILSMAAHNTNTVRTLVHTVQTSTVSTAYSMSASIRGEEDEVANRERDHESVTYILKTSDGQKHTIVHTADVIFISGKTYYRTSTDKNVWHVRPGSSYTDPITRDTFKRARTTIPTPKTLKWAVVSTSGGGTQLRTAVHRKNLTATEYLFISGGSKPFVIRTVDDATQTAGKQKAHVHSVNTYGSFNKPLKIEAPGAVSA